jgi:hypothetical protein
VSAATRALLNQLFNCPVTHRIVLPTYVALSPCVRFEGVLSKVLAESKASECGTLLKISVGEACHKYFRGLSRVYAAHRGYESLSYEIVCRAHYI